MSRYIIISLALIAMPVMANAQGLSPVNQVECVAGGEFGNEIHFSFARGYVYDKIIIKRDEGDFVKELDDFKGGKYRLDVASKSIIKGFELYYQRKDAVEPGIIKGGLSCGEELANVPTFVYEDPIEQ